MDTPTDTATLRLAQMFSPAYPVGAFAYSHGLEWAISQGDVQDTEAAQDWIAEVLRFGAGWNDSLLIAAAYRADTAQDLSGIDELSRALAASSERLKETCLQGDAFCAVTASVWSVDVAGLTYPVAAGRAARLMQLPLPLTTQFYLHAFLSNLVAAATRLVPLGQTDGQQIVRDLTPLCQTIAHGAQTADLSGLSATAFLSDIASMNHETQYSRIFRT